MQSDAFPTPPIYTHQFQPVTLHHLEPDINRDRNFDYLVKEIALLMINCSMTEFDFFWQTTDCLREKYLIPIHKNVVTLL